MKQRIFRSALALTLIALVLCPMFVSAASTGVTTWVGPGNATYLAAVTNNATYSRKDGVILSSGVTMAKGTTHVFGGTYLVTATNTTLWGGSTYASHLDDAGAKVNVYKTYSKSVEFANEYTFTASYYSGKYYAITDVYGFNGSYYVELIGSSSMTLESGSFTFAPNHTSGLITAVIEETYLDID